MKRGKQVNDDKTYLNRFKTEDDIKKPETDNEMDEEKENNFTKNYNILNHKFKTNSKKQHTKTSSPKMKK